MRYYNFVALAFASVMAVNAARIEHCTEPNTIALTFDDGPYEYTEELLDQLKAANIKATFFINGDNWWKYLENNSDEQAVIKRAAAEGHQIASHTWKHEIPESRELLKESLDRLDDLVEKCTGERPKYFRAPKGKCDEDCIAYIEELGYKVIQWDTDTNDWRYKFEDGEDRPRAVESAKEFLTEEWAQERENYLILMHDVHVHTVREIVPWVIKNAPVDKYKFVTVAECLGDKPISSTVPGNSTTINPVNIVPENNTFSLQANQTREASSSDATSIISNLYLSAALLIYALYMLI